MKRREFLIKTALTGAFIAAPKIYPSGKANKVVGSNPLRFPPELQAGESLIFKSSNVEIWSGTTTQIVGMNNSYPGPTIRVKKGEEFSVLFENQHNIESTIHWHGLLVPELMDGQPKDPVLPGTSYRYSFPVFQRAGTYFYHSHAHHYTAEQVYMGHAGFFIIEDDAEKQLGLPEGEFDIPLLIQDRRSVDQPQFVYSTNNQDIMQGYLGDLPLINGTPDAYFEVQKTLYRFRIVNGSNARVYKLALSDNSNFWIIATDGGLKSEAVEVNEAFISPGERIEILYDFSGFNIGEAVNLVSLPFSGFGNQGTQMDLLQFNIVGDGTSGGTVPQNLPAIDYYDINSAVRTRTFKLSHDMNSGPGMHRINDLTYDINRIDEQIPFNELEEWNFTNVTSNIHPMHVHGVMFQVYSRNGNTVLHPKDKGWKDTVFVEAYETVRVLIKFTDYSGRYLLHCHNLEHEDNGMMLNIEINPPTSVEEENASPEGFALHQNYPNPFNPSTTIKYSIPDVTSSFSSSKVILKVYDVLGKGVTTLVNKQQSPGNYSVVFNASGFPSGLYVYKLQAGNFSAVKKMMLLK
ncbi:Multicopper oxidase [hydrothermal vent metagenome]|uniref:Multicopper oxidase n=1 Tax=hydrothermal vent metagenome TaxID=652676 RepID=A0A3B1CBG7_9ZZZZ